MSKPRRHVKHLAILGGKDNANPSTVRRGATPDVHYRIENLSPNHFDELLLGLGMSLIVEPPENAPNGMGIVGLNKTLMDAGSLKLRALVCFHEKTPSIIETWSLDEDNIGNLKPLKMEGHL